MSKSSNNAHIWKQCEVLKAYVPGAPAPRTPTSSTTQVPLKEFPNMYGTWGYPCVLAMHLELYPQCAALLDLSCVRLGEPETAMVADDVQVELMQTDHLHILQLRIATELHKRCVQ